jgi:hypothetical protein
VRQVTRNVKRWRNAEMALRWTAAGLLEAQKTFRRLKAYRLRALLHHHQPHHYLLMCYLPVGQHSSVERKLLFW